MDRFRKTCDSINFINTESKSLKMYCVQIESGPTECRY